MRRKAFDGWAVERSGGWVLPIAFIFLTAQPPNRLSAQELPLNAGALFLLFPVGAQAVGMGQTATAAAGRGEAAFWNPAGLATLSDDEFAQHVAATRDQRGAVQSELVFPLARHWRDRRCG